MRRRGEQDGERLRSPLPAGGGTGRRALAQHGEAHVPPTGEANWPFSAACKCTLRATTMAELLVVMVLSGIVFLSVMDGLGMFRRYATKMAGRIEEAGRFYGDFMRLDGLVSDCDSALSTDEGLIEIYRNGVKCASLAKADSALLAFIGPQPDTLLRGVTAIDCATAQSKTGKDGGQDAGDEMAPARIDTLSVAFATAEGIVTRVSFPTTQLPVEERRERIEEKEEQCKYE